MKLSTVHKQRLSKIARVASAGALVVGSIATSVPAASVDAAALTQNRLTISNSSVGATGVTYTLRFVPTSATPIGSVDVQFCTTANSFGVSCTIPTGFATDEGVLGGATASGFGDAGSGDSGTFSEVAENHVRYVTGNMGGDDEATGPTDYLTLTFNSVFTNPSAAGGGTFFARIRTFSGDDATGELDNGTAVFATVPRVDVTGRVLESMTFTVSPVVDATACGTGDTSNVTSTATSIPFGNFNSGTPKVGCHTIATATNASGGYSTVVRQVATIGAASPIGAMCRQTAGNCVTAGAESGISAANAIVNVGLADTVAEWQDGTTFGLGIAANGAQAGSGFTNATHYRGFYDASNNNIAITVATSAGPTVATNTNVVYQADVPANQTAGLYQNQLMYITTPTF